METLRYRQVHRPPKKLLDGNLTFGAILMSVVLLLTGLTGFLPATLQALGILGCCALMIFTNDIFLVYPVMLFYGSVMGLLFGISLYRWFTLAFFVITVLKCRPIYTKLRQIAVFVLFCTHCIAVVLPDGLRNCFFLIFDMACILLLINCYLRDCRNLKRFFTVYVICAFLAYFTGTQLDSLEMSIQVGSEYVDIVRNMATFEDPNYMGYFYTTAVFAVVCLKLFKPVLRWCVVAVLYTVLLTSLSITALVVNAVLWLLYALATNRLSIKTFGFVLLVVAVVIGLYNYGVKHPDAPVLGALSARISEALAQAQSGDLVSATSGRLKHGNSHMQYFEAQSVYKKIFGMNAASAVKLDLGAIRAVAHNEYIDWLLNVGIIGTAVMGYYLISSLWIPIRCYWRDNSDRRSLAVVMLKFVWIGYAFSLTLYGDYRFMLLFLL